MSLLAGGVQKLLPREGRCAVLAIDFFIFFKYFVSDFL